ncbi:hypothetical protein HanIR_Chr09g0421071 [Helianthus annuus]|nr:hypothetical protein HanIR_Chr09g0421071 [Helianthus annuus]
MSFYSSPRVRSETRVGELETTSSLPLACCGFELELQEFILTWAYHVYTS